MSEKISTVVLVHGAWADGSSWGSVIGKLQSKGLKVIAAPIPLTSLADDVAAVERVLERVEAPVVLVGHAYAGAVIGESNSDKVRALVYVAALAPEEGEVVAQVFGRGAPHPKAPKLVPDSHGLMWLPDEAFGDAFAPDATHDVHRLLAAVQRPISLPCITTPVGRPRWKDVPTWYLLAENDRMIVKDNQEFMASRMNATVLRFSVDHAPSITAPDVVEKVVVAAAQSLKA